MRRISLIAALLLACSPLLAAPPTTRPAAPVRPKTPAELTAEIESLKQEISDLRAQVAALRVAVAQEPHPASPAPSAVPNVNGPAIKRGMTLEEAAAASHSSPTLLKDLDGTQFYSLGDDRFYYEVTVAGGRVAVVNATPREPVGQDQRHAPAEVRRFR